MSQPGGLSGTPSAGHCVAAARLDGFSKLALFEPPYFVDAFPRPPADTATTYRELVAAGRRGDAVEYFMATVVGLPPEFVAYARSQPWWANQEALAHTLAYDAEIMADYSLPAARAASVTVPTLVVDGGASFEFVHASADALAQAMPNATRRTLERQEHNVDPAALAPVLAEFFADRPGPPPDPRENDRCVFAPRSSRPARQRPASGCPSRSSRPSGPASVRR